MNSCVNFQICPFVRFLNTCLFMIELFPLLLESACLLSFPASWGQKHASRTFFWLFCLLNLILVLYFIYLNHELEYNHKSFSLFPDQGIVIDDGSSKPAPEKFVAAKYSTGKVVISYCSFCQFLLRILFQLLA